MWRQFVWASDETIIELVTCMKFQEERFKVKKENLYKKYSQNEIDLFLTLFTSHAAPNDQYLYYASDNLIMSHPLFELQDGRILVLHDKQILRAIYELLDEFCRQVDHDKLFKKRGLYLEDKTAEVLSRFFDGRAFVYKEYKLQPKAQNRQDILLLFKGLGLVVETKAGDRIEPHRNTQKAYEQIYYNFKRNIQKGFEQTKRIQTLFDTFLDFDIYNVRNELLYRVNTKRYHNVFSIIVTLDKFGPAQADLTRLLKIDDGEAYPLSISIDDLETLLLTMKKLKKGVGDLIRFLRWREELQGRLQMNDELSIWGTFITDPNLNPRMVLVSVQMMKPTPYLMTYIIKGLDSLTKRIWKRKKVTAG